MRSRMTRISASRFGAHTSCIRDMGVGGGDNDDDDERSTLRTSAGKDDGGDGRKDGDRLSLQFLDPSARTPWPTTLRSSSSANHLNRRSRREHDLWRSQPPLVRRTTLLRRAAIPPPRLPPGSENNRKPAKSRNPNSVLVEMTRSGCQVLSDPKLMFLWVRGWSRRGTAKSSRSRNLTSARKFRVLSSVHLLRTLISVLRLEMSLMTDVPMQSLVSRSNGHSQQQQLFSAALRRVVSV